MGQYSQPIGSYATVKVTGPQTAVDVLRITVRTVPSGVVFTANAPYKNVGGMKVADVGRVTDIFIEPVAMGIEEMMGLGVVAGAVGAEDTDAAGLLQDFIDATVAYQPQNPNQDTFSQVIRLQVYAFGEQNLFPRLVRDPVMAAYEGLKALAAS